MSDDQDQRKHAPSEKRQKEFRDRGEIARSKELAALVGSFGAVLGLSIADPISQLSQMMKEVLRAFDHPSDALYHNIAWTFITCFFPVACVGLSLTILAMILQLGWPPTFAKIGFDPSRWFSIQGLTGMFSLKENAKRLFSATGSVVLVGLAAYLALHKNLFLLFTSRVKDPRSFIAALSQTLWQLTFYAGGVLLAFAGFLYWRQRKEIYSRMMMTQEEAKREHREQEGDPLIKRQRQRRRRELSRGRMSAVKNADVVVVNPTHFAVALRYRAGRDKAPKVLAKGVDAKAAKIREIARKAGVPIVPQPPLARLLYKVAPEGKEIPGHLYHAVAEILAYVYRLKSGSRAPAKRQQKLPSKR